MSHAKILIADYDDKSLKTINDILEQAGWTTELVKNGKDALDKLDAFKPDLCVIDPMLPGINGFTVSQKIRERFPNLPIVISTGVYKGEKYRRDARSKYGVTAYLEKPYSNDKLVSTVKDHLKKKPASAARPLAADASADDSFGRKLQSSLGDLTATPRTPKKKAAKKTTSSRVDELLEHTLSGIDLATLSSGKTKSKPAEKPKPRVKEPRKDKPITPPPDSLDDSDTMRVSASDLRREMDRVKQEIDHQEPAEAEQAQEKPSAPTEAKPKPAPSAAAPPQAPPPQTAPPKAVSPQAPPPQAAPPKTAEEREALERKLTSSDIFGPLIDDIESEPEEGPPEEAPKAAAQEAKPSEKAPPASAKPEPPKPAAKAATKPVAAEKPKPIAKPTPKPGATPDSEAAAKAKPAAAKPVPESKPTPTPQTGEPEPEDRPKVKSQVIALPEEEKKRHRQDATSNEYQLLSKIAAGGMAEVWKAKLIGEKGFEKIVAVKKILPHLSDNDEFITMFIDEAKVAANLTHPNIAQIYELGKIDGSFFIAMEYVSGQNLRTILNLCNELKIFMPLEITVFIGMKLASALNYAHTKKDHNNRKLNIVHRDISPQNVLISSEGEIKLVDFGIAKASIKASQTVAGSLKGKLLYMSPEQAEGKPLDQRSDVFSLASLLYECVTGKKLIDGDSELSILKNVREANFVPPSKLNPGIPRALEEIFMKALSKDVQDRYPTAKEMEKQLKDFMRQEKMHINETDVVDYLRLLFTKDIKKLAERDAIVKKAAAPKPLEQAQAKQKVIMPDTGEIRAFEDEKIHVKKPESSKKGVWIGLAVIVAIAACVAAAYFFWFRDSATLTPPEDETPQIAETTPVPASEEDSAEEESPVMAAAGDQEGAEPSVSLSEDELAAIEAAKAEIEKESENANKNLKNELAKKQEEFQKLLETLEMTEEDLERLSANDDDQ